MLAGSGYALHGFNLWPGILEGQLSRYDGVDVLRAVRGRELIFIHVQYLRQTITLLKSDQLLVTYMQCVTLSSGRY